MALDLVHPACGQLHGELSPLQAALFTRTAAMGICANVAGRDADEIQVGNWYAGPRDLGAVLPPGGLPRRPFIPRSLHFPLMVGLACGGDGVRWESIRLDTFGWIWLGWMGIGLGTGSARGR